MWCYFCLGVVKMIVQESADMLSYVLCAGILYIMDITAICCPILLNFVVFILIHIWKMLHKSQN